MEDTILGKDVLDRIKEGSGAKSDTELGALLGVSQQAVYNARNKGRVSDSWVYKAVVKFDLSADWVLFGREPHNFRNDSALPEKERDMYLEILKVKDEVIAAKDLAIQAYKDVLRATRANLDEMTDKKGEEHTNVGTSAPDAHFSGRSSRD